MNVHELEKFTKALIENETRKILEIVRESTTTTEAAEKIEILLKK